MLFTNVLSVFRRRLFLVLWLKYTTVYGTVFLFLWGIAMLTLRVAAVSSSFQNAVCYAFGAVALLPVLAYFRTKAMVPCPQTLGAILDKNNHIGGLLMCSQETDLGEWEQNLSNISIPPIRWNGQRALGLVLLAGGFAVASLLLPMPEVVGASRSKLNVDNQVRKLTAQLDVLQEEKILDVEEVESKKLELKDIQNDAEGMGPVKTFDALDHLADRMNQKAAEAVEQAQKTMETLAEAEALSQEVKEISNELDDSAAKNLMDGLAKTLEEMLQKNEELANDLKEELAKENSSDKTGEEKSEAMSAKEKKEQDAMKKALEKMLQENNLQGMSPEQLEQLCETMKQCQGNVERMCEKLQEGGFPFDPEMLKKLAEGKSIEKEEAERMLSDLWKNCDSNCEGGMGCPEPPEFSPRFTKKQDWTTDPNTPSGDKRFTKEADEEGAEFKAKFLPPADLEAFRNSQKIGASISAPDVSEESEANRSTGGVLENTGGTGTAHRNVVYPQHRGTVSRYFEKK